MTHPNGPAGSGPSGASGSSPKAPTTFGIIVGSLLTVFAVYAVTAAHRPLFWPSALFVLAGLGIYVLSRVARTRGQS